MFKLNEMAKIQLFWNGNSSYQRDILKISPEPQ